jgi:hypothetical protein
MAKVAPVNSKAGEIVLAKAGGKKAQHIRNRSDNPTADLASEEKNSPSAKAWDSERSGVTEVDKQATKETDDGSSPPTVSEKQEAQVAEPGAKDADLPSANSVKKVDAPQAPSAAQAVQEVANTPAPALSPEIAKADSAKKVVSEPEEKVLTAKPEEVIKTQKKVNIPFFFEATGRLLLRQRDAKLESRADYAHLSWTQPQPKVLPGLELAGSVGYRVSPTFSLGTQLGLGVWQEKLDVDVSQKEGATALTAAGTNTFVADANYGKAITNTTQWTMAQAHTELWIRYSPKTMPLAIQAAATLDALRTAGDKGPEPRAHKFNPGWAVALRYQPGHFFYEAGVRQPQRNSVIVPDYYKIKYQFVSVGIGYSW